MRIFIKRENFKSQLISNLIKNWNNSTWMLSYPDGKSGHFEWNMTICNLKRLLVVSTHVMNSLLINFSALFVFEMSQELSKWVSDKVNSLLFSDPVWDFTCKSFFHISKVLILFSHFLLVHSSFSSKLLAYVIAFTSWISHHGCRHSSMTSFSSVLLIKQSVYFCSLACIELVLILIINPLVFITI